MPIYEYECKTCGHRLEAFQKMTDSPLIDCPKGHAAALSKLVSAAGFQLKGTGWYATDFRDKGKKETQTDNKTKTTETKNTEGEKTTESKKSKDDKDSTTTGSTT